MSDATKSFVRVGWGVVGFILVVSWGCSQENSQRAAGVQSSTAGQRSVATETQPKKSVVEDRASDSSRQSPDKPHFYTVDHYDNDRDPAEDLAATIARAKLEKKHIFMQVGGDWCGWCKLMSHFIETDENVRDNLLHNYLVMKVTQNNDNKNAPFLSQYPAIRGYPHIFILDSEGKLLHSQGTDELEEGQGYNEAVYLEFLNKWKPAG